MGFIGFLIATTGFLIHHNQNAPAAMCGLLAVALTIVESADRIIKAFSKR